MALALPPGNGKPDGKLAVGNGRTIEASSQLAVVLEVYGRVAKSMPLAAGVTPSYPGSIGLMV